MEMKPVSKNKDEGLRSMIWREYLGKLRTYHVYMPPHLRAAYLSMLNELGHALKAKGGN